MTQSDANKDLLNGFLDESIDALNAADSYFVKLESNPGDADIVNSIFRPVHSLKGNAAYFGLMKIKKLAHTMENLLDRIRKGQCQVNRAIIDALLPGMDTLRTMLTNVRNGGQELTDEKRFIQILFNVESVTGNETASGNKENQKTITDIINTLRTQVTNEGKDSLDKLIQHLSSMSTMSFLVDNETKDDPVVNAILQGAAYELYTCLKADYSVDKKQELTITVSNLLPKLREQNNRTGALEIVEEITDIFEAFRNADTGLDELAISIILDKLEELKLQPIQAQVTDENPSKNAPIAKEINQSKVQHDKTMRIPEETLDDFLRCVGELLSVEEMLRYIGRQFNSGADTLTVANSMKEAIGQFEGISKELRTKIMEVRKVEAKILLQKTPRIVRDIASQTGKKIDVECIGENIRIDKSYIDLLDAPLTHMVRNAADHGVEGPDVRIAGGKPDTGKIVVSISENADDLKLIIQDNGAGLDYDGIQKKAESLGLIGKGAKLTENDVIELLFQSGVSTADKVTDISGRGVGMDVVKRAVVDAGGRIEVTSVPGKGTTFTVSVPRNASTQIFDGYIVRNFSDDMYVLPLNIVLEAFRIQVSEVSSVAGKGEVLSRRGAIFPLHSLDKLLGCSSVKRNVGAVESLAMGVLIDFKGKKTVISVKEIIGIQKVVCKTIEGSILDNVLFDGAAISGTGHVSMIINVEKLLEVV